MARRWQRLDDEARSRLYAVAADTFAREGYHGASLNEMLAQADVSKGAFYHHYADKQDLFYALVELQGRALMDQILADQPAPGKDLWGWVERLLTRLLEASMGPDGAQARALALAFYQGIDADGDGRGLALRRRMLGWVEGVLAAAQATGQVRSDLPLPLLADLSLSVLERWDRYGLEALTREGADPAALQAGLVDTLRRMLAA